MLNYIKSELYRIKTTKSTWVMIGVCAILVVAFNLMIVGFKQADASFPYATTKFSLGTLADSVQILLVICMVITSVVFAGEYKNGTIKNVLAFGISRNKLFIGKYIVTVIFGCIMLLIVSLFYVSSAYLLLEDSGSQMLVMFIKALIVNVPIYISCITLGVTLFFIIQNETSAIWYWLLIIIVIPTVFVLIGKKIQILSDMSAWFPWNMVNKGEMLETGYQYMWETFSGGLKCIVSGAGFSILYFIIGLTLFSKKEIK